MQANTLSLLTGHPLFCSVDTQSLQELAKFALQKTYPAGHVIFFQDEEGDAVYSIISGQVKIASHDDDGNETILTLLDTGMTFGEIALLDGGKRSATASTLAPCELLVITRGDFLKFLADHPGAYLPVIQTICQHLRRLTDQFEETLNLPLHARLARVLMRLADDHGTFDGEHVTVKLPIHQQDLARLAAGTRESANRVLNGWKSEGWFKATKDVMHIKVDRLRQVAGLA